MALVGKVVSTPNWMGQGTTGFFAFIDIDAGMEELNIYGVYDTTLVEGKFENVLLHCSVMPSSN